MYFRFSPPLYNPWHNNNTQVQNLGVYNRGGGIQGRQAGGVPEIPSSTAPLPKLRSSLRSLSGVHEATGPNPGALPLIREHCPYPGTMPYPGTRSRRLQAPIRDPRHNNTFMNNQKGRGTTVPISYCIILQYHRLLHPDTRLLHPVGVSQKQHKPRNVK